MLGATRPPGLLRLVAVLVFASVAQSCERGPTPTYVRLSGAAPAIEGVAATRSTLIVFWASWCAPCVSETPSLVALAEHPPKNLSVVVFARNETLAGVNRFFKGQTPAALNLRLDQGNSIGAALGVEVLPVAYVVADGQLVARVSGRQEWDSKPMRALLERLAQDNAPR